MKTNVRRLPQLQKTPSGGTQQQSMPSSASSSQSTAFGTLTQEEKDLLAYLTKVVSSANSGASDVVGGEPIRVLDLSCCVMSPPICVRLASIKMDAATSRLREVDFSCAVIAESAVPYVISFLENNACIEQVRVDGAVASLTTLEAMAQVVCNNKRANESHVLKVAEARRRAVVSAAARRLSDQLTVLVKKEAAQRYAFEHEWRDEMIMISRAWQYAAQLGALAEARAKQEREFVFELSLCLKQQTSQRVVIEALEAETRCRLEFEQYEDDYRRALAAERYRELRQIMQIYRRERSVSVRVAQCRVAKEKLERARVDVKYTEGYRDIVTDEGAQYAQMFIAFETTLLELRVAQREAKQRAEEERRRAKTRQEDEARDRAFRAERHRADQQMHLQTHLAAVQRIEAAEEAERSRLSRLERTATTALYEVLGHILDIAMQVARYRKALVELERLENVAPVLSIQSSLSPFRPLVLFESAADWTFVDPTLQCVISMPANWHVDVNSHREVCTQLANNARQFRAATVRLIKTAWDKLIEAANRAGFGLFGEDEEENDALVTNLTFAAASEPPLLASTSIIGASGSATRDRRGSIAPAVRIPYLSTHFSPLFGPDFRNILEAANDRTDIAVIEEQRTRLCRVDINVTMKDDVGAALTAESEHVTSVLRVDTYESVYPGDEDVRDEDELSLDHIVQYSRAASLGALASSDDEKAPAAATGGGDNWLETESFAPQRMSSAMTIAPGGGGSSDQPLSPGSDGTVTSHENRQRALSLRSPSVTGPMSRGHSVFSSAVGDAIEIDVDTTRVVHVLEVGDVASPAKILKCTRPDPCQIKMVFEGPWSTKANVLSAALRSLAVQCMARDFGVCRCRLLEITIAAQVAPSRKMSVVEGHIVEREDAASVTQYLPVCSLQCFFTPRSLARRVTAMGNEPRPLGAPWLIRPVPFIVSQQDVAVLTESIARRPHVASLLEPLQQQLRALQTLPGSKMPIALLRPTLLFDDAAVVAAGFKPRGMGGYELCVAIANGFNAENDRLVLDLSLSRALKQVQDMLVFENQVVGKIIDGSFDAAIPRRYHRIRFAENVVVRREIVALVMDALKFIGVAASPVEGVRAVVVRVLPPHTTGTATAFEVEVEAVDVPTTMTIKRKKLACWVPNTDSDSTPSVAIAADGEITDPDTDSFEGGYFRVWLQKPKLGDHLWIANTDGGASPAPIEPRRIPTNLRTPAASPGPNELLSSGDGEPPLSLSDEQLHDVGEVCDSATASSVSDDEDADSDLLRLCCDRPGLVIIPFEQDVRVQGVNGANSEVGLVAFNGKLIGQLLCTFMEPPEAPEPKSSIADIAAAALAGGAEKPPQDPKAKLKKAVAKASAKADAAILVGVAALRIEFCTTGDATIRAAQEILRCLRFTTAKSSQAKPGVRDVIFEVVIGATANRLDTEGNEIVTENQNEPLVDMVQINVLPTVLKPLGRAGSVELSYLENSGVKRLPLFDVAFTDDTADKSGVLLEPGTGYFRFAVTRNHTPLDFPGVKVLEEREFIMEGARIGLVDAPEQAVAMKQALAAVPPKVFAALADASTVLPAKMMRRLTADGATTSVRVLRDNAIAQRSMRLTMAEFDQLRVSTSESTFVVGKSGGKPVSATGTLFWFPYSVVGASPRLTSDPADESLPAPPPADSTTPTGSAPPSILQSRSQSRVMRGSQASPKAATCSESEASSSPPPAPSPRTSQDLEVRFHQYEQARSFALLGFDHFFADAIDQIAAVAFVREKATIAVAYAVPGAVTVVPSVGLRKKDTAYIVRSFTYTNPDPNPKYLLKTAQICIHAASCAAVAAFEVKIIPVDDPLEVYIYDMAPKFRTAASERTVPLPADLVEALTTSRNTHQTDRVLGVHDPPLDTISVGLSRPFPRRGLTLHDPDTPFFDRGTVTLELNSANSRSDYLSFMSVEMQLRQYWLVDNHVEMPPILLVCRSSDTAVADLSTLVDGWIAGDGNTGDIPENNLPPPSSVNETSHVTPTTGARVVDLYTAAGPHGYSEPTALNVATISVATKASITVTTITFRKPKRDDEQYISNDVLTYFVNCIYLHFTSATPAPGPRVVRMTIADGLNPVPGKGQLTLTVQPEFVPVKERVNNTTFTVTRTRAPFDCHGVFTKFTFGLADSEVYCDGMLEFVFLETASEADCFSLKINASTMMIKDDLLLAGKDVVGRLLIKPQYVRLQLLKGKGATGKRIVEFIRSVSVQVAVAGNRVVALVLTELVTIATQPALAAAVTGSPVPQQSKSPGAGPGSPRGAGGAATPPPEALLPSSNGGTTPRAAASAKVDPAAASITTAAAAGSPKVLGEYSTLVCRLTVTPPGI